MLVEHNSENRINFHTDCKKHSGIYGWLQRLFGKAIAVVNDNEKTVYYHKIDLIKKLCLASNISFNTVDINRLESVIMEVLHPIKGMNITAKKIESVFQEVGTSLNHEVGNKEDLIAKLNALKCKHLTILAYKPHHLLENLKPGDIFFKLNPTNSDNMVVRVQKISQHFLRGKLVEREGYKHSHTAIYLGDGKIAEAVPGHDGGVQLRSLDLEDSRFAINQEHDYLISRCVDAELGAEAALIAAQVVKKAKPEKEKQVNSNRHKYAFINAARAVYHSASFGLFAKQRYLKQYIDHKHGTEPMDFMAPKEFFCSNFVAYCYQTAESLKIAPKIIGENNAPPRSFTSFGAAMYRGIWARVNRWKNLFEWDRQVKMKFDAKWMTPHDFRNFVVRNPNLFQDKLLFKYNCE